MEPNEKYVDGANLEQALSLVNGELGDRLEALNIEPYTDEEVDGMLDGVFGAGGEE